MKTFLETALSLLEKAVKQEGNQAKLAERAGINTVTLSRWLTRQRTPNCAELGKVFDVLGISLSEPGIDTAEYIMVPKVSAKAGAGSSLITENQVQGFYAFRLKFLQREGISTQNSVLMDVIGHSMSPLIQHMDTTRSKGWRNIPCRFWRRTPCKTSSTHSARLVASFSKP